MPRAIACATTAERVRCPPRAPHGNRVGRLGRSPDLRVVAGAGLPADWLRSGVVGPALRLQLRGQSRIRRISPHRCSLFIGRQTARTKARALLISVPLVPRAKPRNAAVGLRLRSICNGARDGSVRARSIPPKLDPAPQMVRYTSQPILYGFGPERHGRKQPFSDPRGMMLAEQQTHQIEPSAMTGRAPTGVGPGTVSSIPILNQKSRTINTGTDR